MSNYPSKGHELLEALGLSVVSGGPGGRYPRAEPGPTDGYRYRATYVRGRFQLGVHAKPKEALRSDVAARLEAKGFEFTSDKHVAYRWVGGTLGEAIKESQATMVILQSLLQHD